MTIYFAKMGDWIKIGYTAGEASKRIAQLQTGQPQKIELLGTIAGNRDAESGLHCEFADLRGNGEWFRGEANFLRILFFLIENKHPWYFCRTKDRMFQVWENSFAIRPGVDASAYDDYQVRFPEKKEISPENKSKIAKAFSRRLAQHRQKHGEDSRWEAQLKRCFFGSNIHPYEFAWSA